MPISYLYAVGHTGVLNTPLKETASSFDSGALYGGVGFAYSVAVNNVVFTSSSGGLSMHGKLAVVVASAGFT